MVTDAHEQALLDLQQIDAGRLPEQDAELLAAALLLGRSVRKELPAVLSQHDGAGGEQTAVRPRINFSPSLGALDRAKKLLDESEEQLKERTR